MLLKASFLEIGKKVNHYQGGVLPLILWKNGLCINMERTNNIYERSLVTSSPSAINVIDKSSHGSENGEATREIK